MSRNGFPISELSAERREFVESKVDELKQKRPAGSVVSHKVIADTVGFLVARKSFDPPTSYDIAECIEQKRTTVQRAGYALHEAGFIDIKQLPHQGNGNPPNVLEVQPLMLEALSITPHWQEAARLMTLALALDATKSEAIDAAVIARLEERGLSLDSAPMPD